MFRITHFAPLLAVSAMALVLSTPALAGKADRAREAIAAAEAKIHTAETMGSGADMPHQTADASAALAMAREELASGKKSPAIADAIRASALADAAIGEMQHRKDRALAEAQQNGRNAVDAARQQTDFAQQLAASAQQQTAEANGRAAMAQQSAAISANAAMTAQNAANAANAQSAANVAALALPARVETTVTTDQPVASPVTQRTVTRRTTRRHVVRHHRARTAAPVSHVTTTTVVTQPGR